MQKARVLADKRNDSRHSFPCTLDQLPGLDDFFRDSHLYVFRGICYGVCDRPYRHQQGWY